MTRAKSKPPNEMQRSSDATVDDVIAAIDAGKPIRQDFDDGSRLHIDRPLPFLCVYIGEGHDCAARDIASANASYLITPQIDAMVPVIKAIGTAMIERFSHFILLDVGELERDRLLSADAPYLPPFEIMVSATDQPAARSALSAFVTAVESVEVKYRSPRVKEVRSADDPHARLAALVADFPVVTVRFAPIYRQPESDHVYPDLRRRTIANIFDAGLQAVAAFIEATHTLELPTHRALGRQAFVDAVTRADRSMDEIAESFDFLLAVTPINADAAWHEFRSGGFRRAPRFLYRPLTVQVGAGKRKLFSIAFDSFEDPVLFDLYREKQQELDLQLSMLSAREMPPFVELGRALYRPVEPNLLAAANDILAKTEATGGSQAGEGGSGGSADCHFVKRQAQAMIEDYRRRYSGFEATVDLRDDLPAGLMVSGDCLLISRSTRMPRHRIEALLSHEIGVHLLTYVNGSAQGLRLFRSGLSGYEGVQEGLAVFAEYLAGGMTIGRLRLIAARVVACAAMLEGAAFHETFHVLVRDHGFTELGAFNLTLRLYRGGGLAKDAIYLRGLFEVLDHLGKGGSLDPFWMGKISASHFSVMQELNARGLLKAPQVRPAFLSHAGAKRRLERARHGLSPIELIAS
ncbi:MAG TPA: flavohemoglobin expression-modulating QEGLA motif protein [Pseudaminobacter sp.]|nr:flavohemoglobin expression-modulating QEGLA motif protein [Pseudaminobacter sp.]